MAESISLGNIELSPSLTQIGGREDPLHSLSHQKSWQEQTVDQLRKSRLDDIDLELERLRKENILNSESENRLNLAFPLLRPWNALKYYESKEKEVKVIIGRALEIQKIYKKTHYVFLHAQNSNWLLISDLIKELTKRRFWEKPLHHFKCLRTPNLKRTWGIEKYLTASTVSDHDPETRIDLLSADAYFYHNERWESALYFMYNNLNIASPSDEFIKNTIRYFYNDLKNKDLKEYAEELRDIDILPKTIGNLFVICIPKEQSHLIQYRSHPFGVPCKCHPSTETTQILETLQNGELPNYAKCSNATSPQFRIFTPELKVENGIKIYLITANQSLRKQFKQKIKTIIEKYHQKYLSHKKNSIQIKPITINMTQIIRNCIWKAMVKTLRSHHC